MSLISSFLISTFKHNLDIISPIEIEKIITFGRTRYIIMKNPKLPNSS